MDIAGAKLIEHYTPCCWNVTTTRKNYCAPSMYNLACLAPLKRNDFCTQAFKGCIEIQCTIADIRSRSQGLGEYNPSTTKPTLHESAVESSAKSNLFVIFVLKQTFDRCMFYNSGVAFTLLNCLTMCLLPWLSSCRLLTDRGWPGRERRKHGPVRSAKSRIARVACHGRPMGILLGPRVVCVYRRV